jgi:LPS-assembly lipoprotein
LRRDDGKSIALKERSYNSCRPHGFIFIPLARSPHLVQTPRMTIHPFRLLFIGAFVLAASACGFHLRDALKLPPDLGQVRVVARDPYSPLAQSLTNSLERAGANMAGENVRNAAVLRILSEKWASTPISVDQFGRAQEYTLRYAAVFRLDRADGSVAVPQQAIELGRDYVSAPRTSTGTESEREILARELQREMAASILRRIDAATRSLAVSAPEASAPEAADDAATDAIEDASTDDTAGDEPAPAPEQP